ncbi:MAG: hypothetical protein ACTSRP_16575 [Candidatus Helarchaeota archaeon]
MNDNDLDIIKSITSKFAKIRNVVSYGKNLNSKELNEIISDWVKDILL